MAAEQNTRRSPLNGASAVSSFCSDDQTESSAAGRRGVAVGEDVGLEARASRGLLPDGIGGIARDSYLQRNPGFGRGCAGRARMAHPDAGAGCVVPLVVRCRGGVVRYAVRVVAGVDLMIRMMFCAMALGSGVVVRAVVHAERVPTPGEEEEHRQEQGGETVRRGSVHNRGLEYRKWFAPNMAVAGAHGNGKSYPTACGEFPYVLGADGSGLRKSQTHSAVPRPRCG
jgi:hypothetical protein